MNTLLYLGSDIDVYSTDIIGIFDIEKTTVQKSVNDYLSRCQRNGEIYYVSLDMPKSFVVCDNCTFITNVAAATLKKRANELCEK